MITHVRLRRAVRVVVLTLPAVLIPAVLVLLDLLAAPHNVGATAQLPQTETGQISVDVAPPVAAWHEETHVVQNGDTILSILNDAEIPPKQAWQLASTITGYVDPSDLKPGQTMVFRYPTDTPDRLDKLVFNISKEWHLDVTRGEDGAMNAERVENPLITVERRVGGTITSSLYAAAVGAGAPPNLLMELIHLYSFDVDFQRDVHPGDSFVIVYEREETEAGDLVRNGDIASAELTLDGIDYRMYRYTTPDGKSDYYNRRGESLRKTLLKTPIEGAFLTSGSGYRKHPIQGYSEFHKGLDFGAAFGTPIKAAGDGVVVSAYYSSGFGNHIVLRHPNGYRTLYGHMTRFARGMRPGTQVDQGQIIGYVGSTGVSTGPHLHYEVHHLGRPVNPTHLEFPPGRTLTGDVLEGFRQVRDEADIMLLSLFR